MNVKHFDIINNSMQRVNLAERVVVEENIQDNST